MFASSIDVTESDFGIIATAGDSSVIAGETPKVFDAIFDVLQKCVDEKKAGVPDSGCLHEGDFEVSILNIDTEEDNLTPDEFKAELEKLGSKVSPANTIYISNGGSFLTITYDVEKTAFYLESLTLLFSDREKITATLEKYGIIDPIEKEYLDAIA